MEAKPPDFVVDFRAMALYEAAALVLAIIAFPDFMSKTDAFQDKVRAVSKWAFLRRAEADPLWAREHQAVRPEHLLVPERDLKKVMRLLFDRIPKRMAAGFMATGFLNDALTNGQSPLPEGMARLSLNELAVHALDKAGQAEPGNVKTRIWRPSLRVVHLCTALDLAQKRANDQGLGFMPDLMTEQPFWLHRIIEQAERYETLLPASTRPSIAPNKLIRVRAVG